MKVSQLISLLQEEDQDKQVFMDDGCGPLHIRTDDCKIVDLGKGICIDISQAESFDLYDEDWEKNKIKIDNSVYVESGEDILDVDPGVA